MRSEHCGGTRIWLGKAWFRRGGYQNLVYLTASPSHLNFQIVWFLKFRIGHPPFRVPWSDISAQHDPHWWYKTCVRFTFAKVPDVPLRVMGYRADRIMAASTGRVQLPP